MGWDGSGNVIRTNGTNTGGTVWQDDADADVKIRADRHDTHDQDLADAIEQALNRNGENTPSTNIGWGNHKITNLGDGNSADDAATVGQVQSRVVGVANASGTDALTATFSPAITAFTDKTTVYVRAAAANTSTTPTFKPNALAAKTITKEGNSPLVAGDIAGADHVIILQYSSSNDVWELLNPARLGQVTRSDADINALATSGGGNFPNVNADVTATDEELNKLDGVTVSTSEINSVSSKVQMATGSYTGDGTTSNSITGLGFQPRHIQIVRKTTNLLVSDSAYETWDDLVSEDADGRAFAHLVDNDPSHTYIDGAIKSLDSDGFTVGDRNGDSNPNTNGETYTYWAYG